MNRRTKESRHRAKRAEAVQRRHDRELQHLRARDLHGKPRLYPAPIRSDDLRDEVPGEFVRPELAVDVLHALEYQYAKQWERWLELLHHSDRE